MPKIGEIRKAKEIWADKYPPSNLRRNSKYVKYVWAACTDCGKERWVQLKRGCPKDKYCLSCCRKGDKHPKWKGGRIYDGHGYITVLLHPNDFFYSMVDSQGYVFEHRLVMAQHLGRYLHPWEVVHHKNGIRDDNRIENLELHANKGDHIISHNKGYRDGYLKGYRDGLNQALKSSAN